MNKAYVFVDVDGTLWNDKSVVSFYQHYVESHAGLEAGAAWQRFLGAVRAQQDAGASREELNRWFYQTYFAGLAVGDVERVAASWWRRQRRRDDFWFDNVVARMREHRCRGHALVLVTGSFAAIVAPLSTLLDADHVLDSPLVVRAGRYTGELAGGPMIGAGKEAAVRAFMDAHGIPRSDTYGYGDDDSDLAFLSLLGHPCAVAEPDSRMARIAAGRGWDVLAPAHVATSPDDRQACQA